ncbi:beta-N-acetylhexosaminidase, partial [Micromonospora sp. NPDC049799]
MPTTPAARPETGPEPLDPARLSSSGATAADLARIALQRAGELLAPPAPVRLDDVVPAPEHVAPDTTADFVLPEDAAVRVGADPG